MGYRQLSDSTEQSDDQTTEPKIEGEWGGLVEYVRKDVTWREKNKHNRAANMTRLEEDRN